MLHGLVRAQTEATPDATALFVGARRISYRELDAMANGVAARLRARGVGRGDLVGVCLRRDEWLVPGLLGVLKAGAGYVALDPAYPLARLRFMVADAGLAHVVTFADGPDLVAGPVLVEQIEPVAADMSAPGEPTDIAYVVYTSGSTGQPKGAVIEHRNVVNLVRWATNYYSAAELAGSLAAVSASFDFSVTEIFPSLVTGGAVVIAENLLALSALPARDAVTMITGTPSTLAALPAGAVPSTVRTVNSGGEALTRTLAERLLGIGGVRRLINVYGPTECTTLCLIGEIGPGETGVPALGRPIPGAELSVVDADGRPVADGETGELWIGGRCVGRGYLRRPELTAAKFVRDGYATGDLVRRVDGVFHFVGRADEQVKIRGFRVELGEVEQALAGHPAVDAAVAVADGQRLLGYVASRNGPTEAELLAHMRNLVPDHLVPSRIAVLDALPLGPTGKADRGALPPPPAVVAGEAATDPVERRIAGIVADVLGLPAVGRSDRLADLGGHSLAAAQVVSRVSAEFGTVLPLDGFLDAPTVSGLAALVARGGRPVPVRHGDRTVFPPTDMQREFWTARRLAPDSTVTTAAVRFRLLGTTSADRVAAALDGIVRRHEALRAVFLDAGGELTAHVREPVPVPLAQHDLRAAPGLVESTVLAAARHSFDLAADVPLMRATLIRTSDDMAELVLTVDHIAFDGYSVGVVLEELAAGIAGEPVAAPPLQIGDIALYEGESRGEGRGYPPGRGQGRRVSRPLAAELLARIDRLGAGKAAVFLAVTGVLLGGLTGESDSVIGLAAARRALPSVRRVVGPLIQVLPIRVDTTVSGTFRQLVRDLADRTLRAVARPDAAGNARERGHRHIDFGMRLHWLYRGFRLVASRSIRLERSNPGGRGRFRQRTRSRTGLLIGRVGIAMLLV